MTRPWVVVVAGVSGLLVLTVLIKQFRGSGSTDLRVGSGRVGVLAKNDLSTPDEPTGWIAKSDSHGVAGSTGGRSHAGAGSAWTGSGAGGSGTELGEAEEHTGATVLSSGRRAGGSVSLGGSSGSAGGGSLQAQAAIPAAEMPAGSLAPTGPGGANHSATQEVRPVAPVADPNAKANATTDPAKPEDGGPVLALSFDNTTQPEKGDTAPIVEQGISFDGQGAHFDTDSQFVIPDAGNITGDSGTITFCLQPQWNGQDQTDASLVNLHTPNMWENRLQITKNGAYLRFLMADNTGKETGAGTNITGWQPGERHLVTATWGEALASLYVDGQLIGQQTYPGQLTLPPGTPMYIGSDYPGGIPGAQGSLSNFQVYNRLLPGEEVAGLTANCQ